MEENATLRDELLILQDMYPELSLDTNIVDCDKNIPKFISGNLNFKISLIDDLKVSYENSNITLTSLSTEMLLFKLNSDKYPDFKNSIEFNINSKWLCSDKIGKITDSLHKEFDMMTDPTSDFYDSTTPILMLMISYITNETAVLLFPDNAYSCNSEEEYKTFVQMALEVSDEEKDKNNYDCCICMDTKKGSKMVMLPCKVHRLCIMCIKSYYGNLIQEGNLSSVRCPECKFEAPDYSSFKDYHDLKKNIFTPAIPFKFFDNILSDEMVQRYEKLFYSQSATTLSKQSSFACVICRRCNNWCVREDLNDSMTYCKDCDFFFCFNCLHSWHGYNNQCGQKVKIPREVIAEYLNEDGDTTEDRRKELITKYGEKTLNLEADEYLADKLLDLAIEEEGSNLQRCPSCRTVIQRSEGCNKMKCQVCNTMFCFICGQLLDRDDPYEHFREPWSECYGRLFEGMEGTDD